MHLLRAFGEQPHGFYIDIGAGHPVYDNVSFAFYLRGWRGITVEPNPWLAQLSEAVRPRDIRVQSLVGEQPARRRYYLVERFPRPLDHGRRPCRDRRRANSASAREAMTMPVTTLAALCEQYAPARSNSSRSTSRAPSARCCSAATGTRFRPKVVVVEALAPITMAPAWDDWEPLLLRNGYRFVCVRQAQPLLRRRGARRAGRTARRGAGVVRRHHPVQAVQAGARRPRASRTTASPGCSPERHDAPAAAGLRRDGRGDSSTALMRSISIGRRT